MRLRRYILGPDSKAYQGKDIELPNESGRRDPKLPPPSTFQRVKEGWQLAKAKGLVGKKPLSTDRSPSKKR